jgi:hypothetical protein
VLRLAPFGRQQKYDGAAAPDSGIECLAPAIGCHQAALRIDIKKNILPALASKPFAHARASALFFDEWLRKIRDMTAIRGV